MRYIFPVAARASGILGVDANLRARRRRLCRQHRAHSTNDLPDSIGPKQPGEPRKFSDGRKPLLWVIPTIGSDHLLFRDSLRPFEYQLRGSGDAGVANATFESIYPGGANEKSVINVLSRARNCSGTLGAGVRCEVPRAQSDPESSSRIMTSVIGWEAANGSIAQPADHSRRSRSD